MSPRSRLPILLIGILSLLPIAFADDAGGGKRAFVPIEDLDAVFEKHGPGVLLPREEFLKLAEQAKKNADSQPQGPAAPVVSQAAYAARLDGEQLVIRATFDFQQFSRQWQSVSLPFQGLAVESAQVDGQPARLGPGLVLFANEPGKHTLQLDLSAKLVNVGSDQVAAFKVPPVGVASLKLPVAAGKFLHVDEIPLERPAPQDQPAEYTVALGGKTDVSLRITDQQAEQGTKSLVFAATGIGVHAGPEEVTWKAVSNVQVFGQPVDTLEFLIPKLLEIISVESTGLERWEIAAGPNDATTLLKLIYRQPFKDGRAVSFQGVQTTVVGQPWSVPTLALQQATSQTASILVQHPGSLRVQLIEATGARRIGADELAGDMPDMAKPVSANQQLHFAAWKPDFDLRFVTQPKSRELQASIVTKLDANAREITLASNIIVQTRFAPLFDLSLTIPADWTPTEVTANGQPAPWQVSPGEAGINRLRIPFSPPIAPDASVTVNLAARRIPAENWPPEEEPVSIEFPEVRLENVGVTEGTYQIAGDDDLEIIPEDLTGLDPAPISEQERRTARPPKLAYEYQDTRFTGQLKITRKPTRMAAITVAFHRLEQRTVVSHIEAILGVEGSGVRTIPVFLSESAGSALRFELVDSPARVVEQTASNPNNGVRLWTLQLDQRTAGVLRLVVHIENPRPADRAIRLPVLRVGTADRHDGYIAIEGHPDQQLVIDALDTAGQPLEPFDPPDLPAPRLYFPQQRIVAAYRAVDPDYRLSVSDSRFDRVSVPTAICDRCDLTTVLGETGEAQHKAVFQIRAVGVQSLNLRLDVGATLWSTELDGQPIEVRQQAGGMYAVPLTKTDATAGTRTLQVLYRQPQSPLRFAGTLRLTPPQLFAMSGQGTAQPVVIVQRSWTVHSPENVDIVDSTGAFEPSVKLTRDSLLGSLKDQFRIGNSGDLWTKLLALGVGVIVLVLLRAAFRFANMKLSAGTVVLVVAVAFLGMTGIAILVLVSFSASEGLRSVRSASAPPAIYMSDGAVQYSAPGFEPRRPSVPNKGDDGDYDTSGELVPGGIPGQKRDEMAPPADKPADPFEEMPKPEDDKPADEKPKDATPLPTEAPQTPPVPAKPGGEGPQAGERQPVAPPPAAQPALPPAPPQVAAPKPEPGKDAQTRAAERGGLLSLSIDLQPPNGTVSRSFRYAGTPADDVEPDLKVSFQSRTALNVLRCVVAVAVVAIFWWSRRASAAFRAALAAVGLAIPLGAAPVVLLAWLPIVDGVFLGSLCGLALWLVLFVVCGLKSAIQPKKTGILSRGVPAALALFALTGFLATASAQPPDASKPAPPKPPAPVVIPYDPATDPLKADRVLLPFDKFLELWNQANPDKPKLGPAPADGSVAEALYSAKFIPAAGGAAAKVEITARFAVHNFRDGQITLPLPLASVPLSSAKLDGQTAPLVESKTDAGSSPAIVLSTPGAHVVDLTFTLPAEQAGNQAGKFTLPLRPVAAGTLRFALPSKDLSLKVAGASGTFRIAPAAADMPDGDRVAIVPVAAGGDVVVSWAPTQVRDKVDGIVHVEGTTAVHLDDSGLKISAGFRYTVRQGTLSEASFTLAPGLQVKRITGPDIGGWTPPADAEPTEAEPRTLTVSFRRAVNDSTTLIFELYSPQEYTDETTTVNVPAFAPSGVTRETGTVAVFADKHLAVSPGTLAGLSQVDLSQFAAVVDVPRPATAPRLVYRYVTRPFQLPLLVSRQKPVSKGLAEHAVFLSPRKLRIKTRCELTLTGAPRSEVSLQLPAGYLLNDVESPDVADYSIAKNGDAAILRLELATPRTGQVEFVLDGVVPRNPDDVSAAILPPAPLDVQELKSSAAVWVDSIYVASLQEFSGWKSVDPASLRDRLRQANTQVIQFAFTSSASQPQSITLSLVRATPGLSADTLAAAIVSETQVEYVLALQWKIDRAAETQFTFTAPDWIAGSLDVYRGDGPGRVRQVLQQKLEGGRTRWTLFTEEPQRDRYFVTARAILAPPKLAAPPQTTPLQAPAIVVEQKSGENGAFEKLAAQRQFLMLVNQSPWQIDAADLNTIESIPAEDLPIKVRQTWINQAGSVQRLKTIGAASGWIVRGVQQLQSLPASVNVAEMKLVLAKDGSWRGQASFRVKNRARQFLALRMPEESTILSLFVQDQPARPVEATVAGQEVVLIPMPKTAAGDLSAQIDLVFAGRFAAPLPKGLQLGFASLDLPAPQVLSQQESPEFGAPVSRTEWTVYLPEDIEGVRWDDSDRTNMTQSVEGYDRFLNDLTEQLELLDPSNLRSKASRMRAFNNLKQLSKESFENYANNANLSDAQKKEVQTRWAQVEQGQGQARQVLITDGSVSMPQDPSRTPSQIPTSGDDDLQHSIWRDNRNADDGLRGERDELQLQLEKPAAADPKKEKEDATKQTEGKGKLSGRRSVLKEQKKGQAELLNAPALDEQGAAQVEREQRMPTDEQIRDDRKTLEQQLRIEAMPGSPQTTSPDGLPPTFGNFIPPGQSQGRAGPVPVDPDNRPRYGIIVGRNSDEQEAANQSRVRGANAPGNVAFDAEGRLIAQGGVQGQMGDGAVRFTPASFPQGGLSLKIDLPTTGQSLTFSKVGGEPKLALGLRHKSSLELGFGLGWSLVWLAAAAVVLSAVRRRDAAASLATRVPVLVAALGLVCFLVLPDIQWLGFAAFALAGAVVAWQTRRTT